MKNSTQERRPPCRIWRNYGPHESHVYTAEDLPELNKVLDPGYDVDAAWLGHLIEAELEAGI
jgi:hypothetical protein